MRQCSNRDTDSTPGTATTSSIPRPRWAPTPAASRRTGSSPAARASTSSTATARSLDAFAGLYCVNVGYGRQEIAEAIAEQAKELAYYHAYAGHGTEASITLSRMIVERAPNTMSHVYFGLSGSDANETNIKLVWYINNILGRPEKKKIISRWRGYHGSGIMTGSLTGLELFHKAFDLPRAPILHTEAPYWFRRDDASLGRGGLRRPLRRAAGGADRGRGRRHHRRLHRRADAGHRRHRAAAGDLLAEDPGGAEGTTSC